MHIACSDTEKFPLMERLSAFATTHYDHKDLTLIDGVRVRTIDGWWLVRASNTEAALVVRRAPALMRLTGLSKILRQRLA